jgi:hypothetical protein
MFLQNAGKREDKYQFLFSTLSHSFHSLQVCVVYTVMAHDGSDMLSGMYSFITKIQIFYNDMTLIITVLC